MSLLVFVVFWEEISGNRIELAQRLAADINLIYMKMETK
jgi:hypothetical protein